jgi:sucrose-6-phosphate hydrolase SacC (GH32 family)
MLFKTPVREIASLRTDEHRWDNAVVALGEHLLSGVTGDLFDIEVEFETGGASALGLLVRGTEIRYDVADSTLWCLGMSAPLEAVDGRIRLRVLVDRVSLEIFGNDGRVSLTTYFHPEPEDRSLGTFSIGGACRAVTLVAYALRSIWED